VKLDEEIRKRIDDWARQHQDMLLNEMKSAKGINPGNLPPAAQPAGGVQ